MAIRKVSFELGESSTDTVVRRWLLKNGIPLNLVKGYEIRRELGDMPTITLQMLFDDSPKVDVTPIDKEVREYLDIAGEGM